MNRIKLYRLFLYITGIIKLALLIGILILEIYYNFSLFINKDISFVQKLTNIFGIILVFYGWVYIINDIIIYLRKFIRKHIKSKHEHYYTKEQINQIKEQMKNSTKHLNKEQGGQRND